MHLEDGKPVATIWPIATVERFRQQIFVMLETWLGREERREREGGVPEIGAGTKVALLFFEK